MTLCDIRRMAQDERLTIRLPADDKAALQSLADDAEIEVLTKAAILAIREGIAIARERGKLGNVLLKTSAAHSKAQVDSQPVATVPRVRRAG